MKNVMLVIALGLLASMPVSATSPDDPSRPGLKLEIPRRGGSSLGDLFDQSDLFSPGRVIFGVDYQLISNRGKRPERLRTIMPMVAVNLEVQLWRNLGVRASVSTHWWEEDKVLFQAPTIGFREVFEYQYWSAGLGFTWHFNVGDKIDPYIGFLASWRRASATCECYSENNTLVSMDLFIGARYFYASKSFLSLELGNHGVGYAKLGLGFAF